MMYVGLENIFVLVLFLKKNLVYITVKLPILYSQCPLLCHGAVETAIPNVM